MSFSQHVEESTKHDDRDDDAGDAGLSNSLVLRPVVDLAKSARPLNALAQARLRREQMSNAAKSVRHTGDRSTEMNQSVVVITEQEAYLSLIHISEPTRRS